MSFVVGLEVGSQEMRVPAGLVSGEDSSPLSDSGPLTVLSHRGVGVWRGESSLWCLRARARASAL